MIETHSIRLLGPWLCQVDDSQPRRIRMPARFQDLGDLGIAQAFICRRRFGCPTCLDPHERVFLVMEGASLAGTVSLNDEVLGPVRPSDRLSQFDVTDRLNQRNEMVIAFQGSDARDTEKFLFGEVRLEIRG
jgi:hypothetical protein